MQNENINQGCASSPLPTIFYFQFKLSNNRIGSCEAEILFSWNWINQPNRRWSGCESHFRTWHKKGLFPNKILNTGGFTLDLLSIQNRWFDWSDNPLLLLLSFWIHHTITSIVVMGQWNRSNWYFIESSYNCLLDTRAIVVNENLHRNFKVRAYWKLSVESLRIIIICVHASNDVIQS